MKALFLVLLVASAIAERVVTDELVAKINSMGTTWRASADTKHARWETEHFKRLLGAHPSKEALPERVISNPKKLEELPKEYDPRKEHGDMCPSLNLVRDQGDCGSCWAFAAAGAITDRICLATKGRENPLISTDELVGCCSVLHAPLECTTDQGCNGGQVIDPWKYWASKGIVSGGLYGDMSTCQPYSCQPCEHHTTGSRPKCSDVPCSTPKCVHTCKNSTIDYKHDKQYGDRAYSVRGEAKIMQDLLEHGPLSCAFSVYSDFEAYTGGIYQHHSGQFLGGHAVKMMGWGEENGVKYWLIANSWNSDWGENGYFRIRRGTNECGIESDVAGGIPK